MRNDRCRFIAPAVFCFDFGKRSSSLSSAAMAATDDNHRSAARARLEMSMMTDGQISNSW